MPIHKRGGGGADSTSVECLISITPSYSYAEEEDEKIRRRLSACSQEPPWMLVQTRRTSSSIRRRLRACAQHPPCLQRVSQAGGDHKRGRGLQLRRLQQHCHHAVHTAVPPWNQGLTLVQILSQPELLWSQQLHEITQRIQRKLLTSSRTVDKCNPLIICA